MLLGEDYQAALPQQRERPSAPTPSEQHWLQHKVLNIGELGTGILVPQKTTATSGHLQWCAVQMHSSLCLSFGVLCALQAIVLLSGWQRCFFEGDCVYWAEVVSAGPSLLGKLPDRQASCG